MDALLRQVFWILGFAFMCFIGGVAVAVGVRMGSKFTDEFLDNYSLPFITPGVGNSKITSG